MTDENENQNTDGELLPINDTTIPTGGTDEPVPNEIPIIEQFMKPDEPTKPATPSTPNEQPAKNKSNGTKKDKTGTAVATNKKDYTAIVVAVVALALGLLLIYLRNRNQRNAAAKAAGVIDGEDATFTDVSENFEAGPRPGENVNGSHLSAGGKDVTSLFNDSNFFDPNAAK